MKKILLYFAVLALATAAFVGCGPKNPEGEGFNAEHLWSGSGDWEFTWNSNEMLHHFSSNGTGYEINRTESTPQQAFRWELAGNRLTITHIIEMGGAVPLDYTVTTLTEYRLEYRDDRGRTISCSKVRGVE